jgi:hypothetical protein
MPNEPSPEDVLKIVQGLMGVPAIKAMTDLDRWGMEKGLDSDRRAAAISAISGLIAMSSDVEAAKEYIRRAVDVIASLGPALVGGV